MAQTAATTLDRFRDMLVDPRGERLEPEVDSPRPDALAGKVLGLLDNRKWNANLLLRSIGQRIDDQVGLREVRLYQKPTWGQPVEDALADAIARECDMVVTASGD